MANDINRLVITGRLTCDAELRADGKVLSFGVACNRSRKVGEEFVDEATFFDAAVFGNRAKGLAPYLKKGLRIALDGKLRTRAYRGNDGSMKMAVEIDADELAFVDGNREGFESVPKVKPADLDDGVIPF